MPFASPLVDDFLFLATKKAGRKTQLQTWTEERLTESAGPGDRPRNEELLAWKLETGPFKDKSVVRLGDRAGREIAYLKIFTGSNGNHAGFEKERANRAKVQEALDASPSCRVRIPQSYGSLNIGSTVYHLESASNGEKMSNIVRRLGYFDDASRVEHDFRLICDRIVELTPVLQGVSDLPPIDRSWLQIPSQLATQSELVSMIEHRRYFSRATRETPTTWIQHGDFSIENTHLNGITGELHVFDWGDLADGFPPLYDVIEFFVSVAYLTRADERTRFESEEERWLASFRALFFTESSFGVLASRLISQVCERLGVSPEQFPSLLLDFLIIRCSYYAASSVQHRVHVRVLQACVDKLEWLQQRWGSIRVPEAVVAK